MSTERIDRLEERLAWLERHVTAQDKTMLELYEEIARLNRDLSVLRLRADANPAGGGEVLPPDERPPHY